MIKKSEKLVCAFISLAGTKYDGGFVLKNLLFTAQELVEKANELFDDSNRIVRLLDLQNATKGIGSASDQKLFVKGSDDSLNDYYRLAELEEVGTYDYREIISKLMPAVHSFLPQEYIDSHTSQGNTENRVVSFLKEYFEYIRSLTYSSQMSNGRMSSREAVWIAAAALTYNEYVRTNSTDIENYLFSQSSISRLASVFNPQTAAATYSQVTGQMVTQGKNNQNYAYLIPVSDKRRIAAKSDDTKICPEQFTSNFNVNTIDGVRTVQELADFISEEYTAFIESGIWEGEGNVKKLPAMSASCLEKIQLVIQKYKENFGTVDKQERYKWEAIGWYKQHWNIDAEDFAEMLRVAFSKSANLLTSGMYYPYKMITEYAKADPESVRKIFRILHDENRPLAERYQTFRQSCKAHIDQILKDRPDRKKALNHYQDLRAVMAYLTFQYPEKYYLFKSTMYSDFRDRVGFIEDRMNIKTVVWKVENFIQMCDAILEVVRTDDTLVSMHKSRLDSTCYQDESLHLLTMDIVFYGAVYMSEEDFTEKADDHPETAYWPTLDEYNPGITKEMWISALNDRSTTTPENLDMLQKMVELGGESTCAHLAEVYGKTHSYYNKLGSSYGEKVKRKFGCPDCPDRESDSVERNRVYVIPFVGRYVIENGNKRYSWKLRDELKEALMSIEISKPIDEPVTDVGLNTILYGPPGTGKTYHTVIYAVAIIENKELATVEAEDYAEVLERYNEYKAQGRIEFTTFHQSYGYEEFIEGIKPVIASDEETGGEAGEIQYSVQPGVFKRFCEKAERPAVADTEDFGIGENPSIWKVSLYGTGDNPIRTECLKNGHIRIGWDDYGKDITDETDFTAYGGKVVLNAFMNRMQIGDIVLSCYSSTTIDAVGVVTGECEWHDEYEDLKRVRKVKWLVKNIRENIMDMTDGTVMMQMSVYRLNVTLTNVMKIVEKYKPAHVSKPARQGNYVFIVDEINRGNISKIFGELITLIESTKRLGQSEGMSVRLPYSQKLFGVPKNVYIIGTMNTADRSIATIDTALRRRFLFREMMPAPKVLEDINVEDLSISELLTRLNRRISVLYDREHTIGHAYFMPLKDSPTIETLAEVFTNNIIPLLQEYFYEDYEKIRLVLGDNKKSDPAEQFIIAKENDYAELFGDVDIGLDDGCSYEINYAAFGNIEAYRSI